MSQQIFQCPRCSVDFVEAQISPNSSTKGFECPTCKMRHRYDTAEQRWYIPNATEEERLILPSYLGEDRVHFAWVFSKHKCYYGNIEHFMGLYGGTIEMPWQPFDISMEDARKLVDANINNRCTEELY